VNSKIVAIIPARAGSKGLINKNIRLLGSKPLIDYSIEFALNSYLITDVIVSTDIKSVYDRYKDNNRIIMHGLRPEILSNDTASTSDVIRYELDLYNNLRDNDLCVLLQPTCPLRRHAWLQTAIDKLKCDNHFSSAISMVTVDGNHPYRMYAINEDRADYYLQEAELDPLKSRQLLDPLYIRSGHIYAFPVNTLFTYGNIIGPNIFPIKIPLTEAVNIDSLADWYAASSLLDSF